MVMDTFTVIELAPNDLEEIFVSPSPPQVQARLYGVTLACSIGSENVDFCFEFTAKVIHK